ncbi:MAG: PEP-CTERM sorting domain-containing protein [Leptothrix sp. (in: b-proteobacteria)]
MTRVIRQIFISTLVTGEFSMNLKSLVIAGALAVAASSGFAADLTATGKDLTTGNHLVTWTFDAGTFDRSLLDFSASLPGHVSSVYLDTVATQFAFDSDNGVWQYTGSITGGSHSVNAVANGKLGMYTFDAVLSNGTTPTFTQTTPSGVVASVPEPETYAMMLAGLGALGFVGRRRKSK